MPTTTPPPVRPTGATTPARHARRGLIAAVLAAATLLAGCFDQSGHDGPLGLGEQALGEVRTDLSCDELAAATRAQLSRLVDLMDQEAYFDRTEETLAPAGSEIGQSDAASGTSGDGEDLSSGDAAEPAPSSTAVARDEAGGEVVAGTNVREAGVDESDIVKTDGKRIVSVVDGVLRVVTLDDDPRVDGVLALGDTLSSFDAELFLRGDEALVVVSSFGGIVMEDGSGDIMTEAPAVGQGSGGAAGADPGVADTIVPDTIVPDTIVPDTIVPDTSVPDTSVPDTSVPETTTTTTAVPETTTTVAPPAPIPFDEGVTLVRVDLSDPANPREVERRTVEGSLVAARMVDGTARVVVRSLPAVVGDLGTAADLEDAAQVVEELDADSLLPHVATDGRVEELGTCQDVAVLPTVELPGTEDAADPYLGAVEPTTVSVLSVGDTLDDLAPTTVQGMADVVYASPSALYVTASEWDGRQSTTAVHRFDTAGAGAATYTGSGAVPGVLLDDYSLSESDGDLRVVTTVDTIEEGTPTTSAGAEPGLDIMAMPSSEGRLTILRPAEDGSLREISHVEDLGEGERVQSVRYLGDLAYVVTFRQTDPLYAIDLADPAEPAVLGALKVSGFSQYLHPVGDGLLLGLGREADESGADEGFKVSLFDVSDPTSPAELDKIVIPDGWSPAADDPHAFTWDPVAGHAVFPLERYGVDTVTSGTGITADEATAVAVEPGSSAMVVAVDGRGLRQVGELRHDGSEPWKSQILRSLVVDRDLWTLSRVGIGLSDADAPTSVTVIPF